MDHEERITKMEAVLDGALDALIALQRHVSASMDWEFKRNELLLKSMREPAKRDGRGACRCDQEGRAWVDWGKGSALGHRLMEMVHEAGSKDPPLDARKVSDLLDIDALPRDRDKWGPHLEAALQRAIKAGALSKRTQEKQDG